MHKDGEEKRCSQGGTDEDQRHGIIKICYNRVNTVVHGEIRQLLLPEKTNSSTLYLSNMDLYYHG